ncbi:MAG TPA: DUF6069 family protein [Pseudonocardia sp.]
MVGEYRNMGPDDEYGRAEEYGRAQGYPPSAPPPVRTEVNIGRLWAGGVAAAVVAALIALVGLLVARALFQIAVLSPKRYGAFGDDSTLQLCVIAAAAAILATGLVHLLLVSTPSPLSYFGWIVGLLTVAAVVAPFLASSSWPIKLAEATIHLVIGIAIGGLVSNAAVSASRLTLRDQRR